MILGSTSPRLFTPPLEADRRGLPVRTRGHELVKWAEGFREPLYPWQAELALRGLELGADGLYRFGLVLIIVARQAGKTALMRLLALWRLFDQQARLVVAAGQDRSRSFQVWEEAIEAVESHPDYSHRLYRVWRRTNDEYFRVADEQGEPGGYYRIKAATRSSGRGPSADLVPFDELREQTDWEGWAALSKTTMARPDAQIWAFSNAGDLRAVVLRHLREVALSGSDPTIGIFEWSAPEHYDIADPGGWALANPTMNRPGGIRQRAIQSALSMDPPEVFRTEVLCQFRDLLDSAIDASAWEALADPGMTLDAVRDRVALVLDASPDLSHITAAAAGVGQDGRVRAEVVGAWESSDAMRAELPELRDKIKPVSFRWFAGGPAAALKADMVAMGAEPIPGEDVPAVCQGLREQVTARRVIHNGDPLATVQIGSAGRLYSGDRWRFVRRGAPECDAVYALAGAVHDARTAPVELPLGKFVIQ